MTHWLLDTIDESRQQSLAKAQRVQLYKELLDQSTGIDDDHLRRSAEALEMVVIDLIVEGVKDDEERLVQLRLAAADAFRLYRSTTLPEDAIEKGNLMLRASALAVLGDKGADAARWMREHDLPRVPVESVDWYERTWATVIDIWLRLIRKDGWSDRDVVLERVEKLRESQHDYEKDYLDGKDVPGAKQSALELIGLYHLTKAAETLALYTTDGIVDGKYQIHQLLEAQFDRIIAVCEQSRLVKLEPLSRLLAACASQMADNSIWTVTRAVNSRVTEFVRKLVDRGRGDRAIFDVLPPQRRTLAEKGLLGSSRRAVVVSLPTSSGKTLIAEFRLLQALNQFDHERGWVAYLAPTRTLVNQVTRHLRRDLEPLGIVVEQVSPALEIDNIESELLQERDESNAFRILVTTPEKLDLMLRQGWEAEIGRPLTLVIVDEAHNLQSTHRGLKLELLLATINSECQRAQFLLLTPFISNAREVARWLGGANSEDISLALDWQPNDRVIGIITAEQGAPINARSHDYNLRMETIHTSRQTLAVDELITLPKNEHIASTYRKASTQVAIAAVAAQRLQERGPVIVMHARPDWVWSLAERFKIGPNQTVSSRRIDLVQKYLELEYGAAFPLVDLLRYGVGVHHGGLSDEVRRLMEWLFEEDELRFLVSTTTIAQGVNFPVSGVVMASHQYPGTPDQRWLDMPPEDFWNIAGRAGRITQGHIGVVGLVASDAEKADDLRRFINEQSGELNSALIALAQAAQEDLEDLGSIVYRHPEWSSFLQYLAHTYRQMGQPESFVDDVEHLLRNTFGFEKLRTRNSALANQLLDGVRTYSEYLQEPGRPLKLVDSTGFSLQSIMTALTAAGENGIDADAWSSESIFSEGDQKLPAMMGVLLRVPELRDNLKAATGGPTPNGDMLARILKDWVNGASMSELATRYFRRDGDSDIHALTKCGQNLHGRLTQTAAWGLGALLSITGGDVPEAQMRTLANLPSKVFYGVNTDEAVALRLLGIPRSAASRLAESMGEILDVPLAETRGRLRGLDQAAWQTALGENEGPVYQAVWRVLEGIES